jgi:hypothetical protein
MNPENIKLNSPKQNTIAPFDMITDISKEQIIISNEQYTLNKTKYNFEPKYFLFFIKYISIGNCKWLFPSYQINSSQPPSPKIIIGPHWYFYFIMLFIAVPIVLNLDYILHIWLGNYPPHTTSICMFIIIGVLIETLSGPLWVSIFATGKIRTYQIVISCILLMNIPLAFIVGKANLPPAGIYAIRASLFIVALITRLIYLKKLINLSMQQFAKNVIYPITLVSLPLFALIFAKYQYLPNTTFISFMIESIVIVLIEVVVIGWLGLNKNERGFISRTLLKKIKR